MSRPWLSVVIPARDEAGALPRVLASTGLPGVERIVVDGASRDGTAAAARELGAEQVLSCEPGRARQMDAGFHAARADVLLFLHADTRLEPGWENALRRALEDPQVMGGAFELRFDSREPGYRWLERGVRLRCRIARLPYGDQGLFVRREVLAAAGGIRPVPIFEDLDLVRLIRRSGRLALLRASAFTSPRRYARNGIARTVLRNNLALLAWALGLPRGFVARWYRRRPAR